MAAVEVLDIFEHLLMYLLRVMAELVDFGLRYLALSLKFGSHASLHVLILLLHLQCDLLILLFGELLHVLLNLHLQPVFFFLLAHRTDAELS